MVENTPAGMLTKQKQPLDPRGGAYGVPLPFFAALSCYVFGGD